MVTSQDVNPDATPFRRFFNLARELLCVVGHDGRVMDANPAWQHVLGYPIDELRRMSVLDVVHPQDRAEATAALRRAEAFEARFRGANGSYRCLHWTVEASEQEGSLYAAAHDVTDQKANGEAAYRRLFDTWHDGMLIVDAATGRITDANPRAAELLGYSRDELAGAGLAGLAPFQQGDLGAMILTGLRDRDSVRYEQSLPGKDGGKFDAELLCNIYTQGVKRIIQCNIRDISDRKRAEASLRESEERFRLLVESVQDYAIFMLDATGHVVSWNVGAERILGYSEKEILGRHGSIIFTPEDIARGEAEKELNTARTEGRAEDERWHLRKDGSRFFASGVLTALWDQSGGLRGYAKIMRDFTERKNTEDAIRQAQKLESIGLLAGGIAHDFNNLLTGILGNTSLALEEIPPLTPPRAILEEVVSASMKAADLTRQLLAYAGKSRFTTQQLNISGVIPELLTLLRTSIPDNVELEVDLQGNLPNVEADPVQLQQVMMNLVINAGESIEGPGRVTISTGTEWLGQDAIGAREGLRDLEPGRYVYLEVRDTGSGMAPETQARIFDLFFTTKFTGRGLGLAAVSGIVRAHKGAIQVHSSPGSGSTFRVYLRACEPVSTAAGEDVAATGVGAPTILVVDDEPMVQRIARRALERHGYNVVVAANGKEAIDVFTRRASEIDLILLDMAMPVMSGDEAFPHLRTIREVPVIVSSGYSETMASQRFGTEGISGFLQKPYTADDLAERVRGALERN